jgi:LmbE family N-acetylglucosaminyl deacetylase
MTRRGCQVTVLTVLAGDPASSDPAAPWDASCGFGTAGEAARERRNEDRRACEILGANPVWLPYSNEQYDRGGSDNEILAAVRSLVGEANGVLVPGFPLVHADHLWVARLLRRKAPSLPMRFYVEQPYASDFVIGRGYSTWPLLKAVRVALRRPGLPGKDLPRDSAKTSDTYGDISWLALRAQSIDVRAKREAILAYTSQLEGLGRHLVSRIRLYERAWGGEGIGTIRRDELLGS